MESLSGKESSDRLIINKLVKKFGKKTAVNNLSLTISKNEILVLLGHNGAGKTSTKAPRRIRQKGKVFKNLSKYIGPLF